LVGGRRQKQQLKKTILLPSYLRQKKEEQKMNEQYEDIEAPDFFRFTEPGTRLEGIYNEDQGVSERYGFHIYSLTRASDKELKRFHGNSQLDDLMRQCNPGDYLIVAFVEYVPTARGEMKRFTVQRKRSF